MKNKIAYALTILVSAIHTGCVEDIQAPIEVIENYENGFSNCFMQTFTSKSYCTEQRSYSEQINNSDVARFDHSHYTPVSNHTNDIEGTWLSVSSTGNSRETCQLEKLNDISHSYLYSCVQSDDLQFNLDISTMTVDLGTSVRPGGGRTTVTTGTFIDYNQFAITVETTDELEDGSTQVQTVETKRFIRLAEAGLQLGKISIEKFDFENNLLLMEEYPIYGLSEMDGDFLLVDLSNNPLAAFSNDIVLKNTSTLNQIDPISGTANLYGNAYNEDLFPGINKDLFDGINNGQVVPTDLVRWPNDFELRLRQFDYVQNNAQSLKIDFLINRRQATKFLRGDTKGSINLSF